MGNSNYGTWWYWLGLVLVMRWSCSSSATSRRSQVGRAWVAIREDEDAAEMMGVNTFKFKLWAFVIRCRHRRAVRRAVCRPGSVRHPHELQHIINSMLFLSAVVLGGQGNKLGVIFGAFVIVYLPNRLMGVHLFGVNLGDPVPVLRPGAGAADDLPAAGPVPGAPAAAGLRQAGT